MKPVLLLLLSCWLNSLVSASVTCPDGNKTCRDQETCCFTDQGYKCCGYPNAVCCADQAHCCPQDFICDQTTQMCERRPDSSLLLPAKLRPSPLREATPSEDQAPPSEHQAPPSEDQAPPSVVYCDNYHTCPDGYTCCKHPAGGWSCCPLSPARCCLDGYHCCPYGYDCDKTYTHCIKQGVPYPFSSRRPSTRPADPVHVPQSLTALLVQPAEPRDQAPPSEELAPPSVVYCDNYHTCPNGYTCCKHPAGGWSCCPLSPARCCLDGYHCCPYGYDCDKTYTHCIKQGVPYPFSSRRPSTRPADPVHVPQSRPSTRPADPVHVPQSLTAEPVQPALTRLTALGEETEVQGVGDIRCDARFFCPKGSSCCRTQSSEWSCCPFPLGSCCKDGKHCCQFGYECDATSTVCNPKWN